MSKLVSYIIITLLAGVCVLLAYQNRELKHKLSTSTSMSEIEPLKPGDKAEPFLMTTLDGATKEFAYTNPARKYLLFVLSTTCPHCEKTLPVWKSIAQKNNDNCDIIGISIHSLDETKKYIGSKDVGFYVVSAMSDTSFNRKYKISGVPETILVSGDGVVEKAWIGELTYGQVKEIDNLMGAPGALGN
jgi:thiol-disulfide isomerase/thioredoxin